MMIRTTLRTIASDGLLPQEVEHRSLITLREKLIKIGANVIRPGRYIAFQLAEDRHHTGPYSLRSRTLTARRFGTMTSPDPEATSSLIPASRAQQARPYLGEFEAS